MSRERERRGVSLDWREHFLFSLHNMSRSSAATSLAIGLAGACAGSLAAYVALGERVTTPTSASASSSDAKKKAVVKSEAELFHSHELAKRRVHVIGRIDDKSAKSACGSLFYLNDVDATTPIVMYLNSGGGSVTAGLAIYDTMRHVAAPVHTVCLGHCESMAAILLAAGERRYATPNSRVMIHQPSHVIERSTTSDVIIKAEKAENTRRRLAKLICDNTGQSEDAVNKAIERNTYMNADEAKAFGVIDEVIVSQRELKQEQTKSKKVQ